MPTEQILAIFVAPIIVGSISALITNRVVFRKFISERWWEKKAETYSNIIVSLVTLANTLKFWRVDIENSWINPDHKRGKKYKQLSEEYREALLDLERKAIEGNFLISEKATIILADFFQRFDKIAEPNFSNDDEILNYYNEIEKTVKACLGGFRFEARKDLGVSK